MAATLNGLWNSGLLEQPSYPHRLNIKHAEAGSGLNLRRRSVARFDVTNVGGIDTTKTKTTSAYLVLDIPIGNSANYDDAKLVMANLLSFCATTGAATTVLFDGTGHGAASLLAGSL